MKYRCCSHCDTSEDIECLGSDGLPGHDVRCGCEEGSKPIQLALA